MSFTRPFFSGFASEFAPVPPSFFPDYARSSVTTWQLLRFGGGATLMTAMGLAGGTAPTSMWLFETSITAATDLTGSTNLTNDGTTLAAATDSAMGGTVIEWDDGLSDRMAAANGSALDCTTDSVAALVVTRLTATPGGTRALVGKTNGTDGYEFQALATGALRQDCRDGGSSETRASTLTTYNDGSAFVAIGGLDRTQANEIFFVSNREARVQANLTLASMTNAAAFRIGTTGNASSAPMHTRLVAIWLGAGAEQGFTQTHCSNLKSYLGV